MRSWRSAERSGASKWLRRRPKWQTRPRKPKIRSRMPRLEAQLKHLWVISEILGARIIFTGIVFFKELALLFWGTLDVCSWVANEKLRIYNL